MNKQLEKQLKDANQLGKDLITITGTINGYDQFKDTIENNDLCILSNKSAMPLAAFISEDDVNSVKEYLKSIVNEKLNIEKERLNKLLPN